MLTDGVGRVIPSRDLVMLVNGQEITSISVDGNGSFTGFVPIAPDMELGPMVIGIEFAGEDFLLPSESSVVFTVFSPVFLTMDQIGPIAVGDVMLISGSAKDNLEDGWLGSQTIEVFVDGVLVGITSSQENGNWSLEWVIPESMDIGNHSIAAISPAQGFYRQGLSLIHI